MIARRIGVLVLALVSALLIAGSSLAGGKPDRAPSTAGQAPTDQLVVRLAPGKTLDEGALAATAGIDLKKVRKLGDGAIVLKLPKHASVADVRAISERLAASDAVASAEPDELMQPLAAAPDDALWSSQWDMLAPVSGAYGLNLLGAWDVTQGSAAVNVGVIDTGYRPHVDLTGRFVAGYDFIGDTLIANDGNGRDADASDPGDWITSAESASGYFQGCGASASSWHGTHVAGTIGAVANNAIGVAGINQVSKIQPLRVLGKCGGYTSDIADAIRWGAGLSVAGVPANPTPDRVLNLSLGGSGACSSTYQNAINAAVAAGTVVVVAAGNSNANASLYQPASCANVITVASTGQTGSRAYYSNYGSTVEIAAPGGDKNVGPTIVSTLNAGTTTPGADSYATYQGTSMATPHVVGVVSLMLSINPALTPAQVTSLLQSTATPFPAGSTCSTTICGSGIVNAGAAVAAAAAAGSPTAPAAFAKTAPANLGSVAGTSATLQWAASAGAAGYAYCLDTTNDDACTGTWVSVGTATSATVSGLAAGTTYYWQVRASNPQGDTYANGGTWWMFGTTLAAPGAFSKSTPANNTRNLGTAVALTWAASTGAATYEWCVSRTTGSCASWTSTTSRSATVALTKRTTYYWQVRAVNGGGTTNANGGTWWKMQTK